MSELGPPPPPKKVNMPVMTEIDKKRLTVTGPPPPGPPGPPPMIMTGTPMPFSGGFPSVGGMGPNLVFNFSTPYGMMTMPGALPPGKVVEEEEKITVVEGPPPLVQGDPTWSQPRQRAKKGEPLQKDPCVIM